MIPGEDPRFLSAATAFCPASDGGRTRASTSSGIATFSLSEKVGIPDSSLAGYTAVPMKTPLFVVAAGMLMAPAALAQSSSEDESAAEQRHNSMDRFFVLSESAAVPPTDVRAETSGEATSQSGDAPGGLGVSERVEFVLLKGLSLRAGAELRNTGNGFTPSAQAKYQFLNQKQHGLNMAAGLRYKQVGFQSDGGEAEAFVAAGRRWGQVLGTANLVVGTELGRPEGDFEGHVGLGYLLTENLVVGLNTRYQHEFETENVGRHPGREFELMGGAMVGYNWNIVDVSLLGGYYMPRSTDSSGPLAMLRVGLNF